MLNQGQNSSAWQEQIIIPGKLSHLGGKKKAPQPLLGLSGPETKNIQEPLGTFNFQENGTGTILFYQNYCNLFYNQVPLEKQIFEAQLDFLDSDSNTLITLKISDTTVLLDRFYNTGSQFPPISEVIGQSFLPLFPAADKAPEILYKKLWIQVNRLTNTINVSVGDMYNAQKERLLFYDFDEDFPQTNTHNNWIKSDVEYHMPPTSGQVGVSTYNPRVKNILALVTNVRISVVAQQSTSQSLSDFLRIKFMSNVNSYSPVLEANPSFLSNKVAPLAAMPKQIQILYAYLQKLNLTHLPDFQATNEQKVQRQAYLGWRDFQFAVQQSLITPYGYTSSMQPIGIFNHLYKMKIKKQYQELKFANPTTFTNQQQLLQYIYQNRSGYIRLELTQHDGTAPGSMAVVEVWPPYHCSILHNHGQALGLIKVLSGTIDVQNFNELNFLGLKNEVQPYQQMRYRQDQYTWLSEYSFGIHRLVNLHPETCITLQSYYRSTDTTQYFTFVDKSFEDPNVNALFEFYPQNDWINYINLVNEPMPDGLTPEQQQEWSDDMAYIWNIINRYNLKTVDPKVFNTAFYQMALILKDTYEVGVNFGSSTVPEWAVSSQSSVAFVLDDQPNENSTKVINELENHKITVVHLKNVFSFKSLVTQNSKFFKKANKKIAILNGLNHFSTESLNKSSAINFFQELESYGINYNVGVSVNHAGLKVHKADEFNPLPKVNRSYETYDIKTMVKVALKGLGLDKKA